MTIKGDPGFVLPPIPAKRYFTIGEVSELCGVKPHVLRYWEHEFTQLRPMKRRGNRRYYQHHEVLLIRRIRELLYEEGFTIQGARNRLGDSQTMTRGRGSAALGGASTETAQEAGRAARRGASFDAGAAAQHASGNGRRLPSIEPADLTALRADLERALELLR